MYRTISIQIRRSSVLYNHLEGMSKAAKNLYNAALFRIRNVFTALSKKPEERMPKELEVLQEIQSAFPTMLLTHPKLTMPDENHKMLSYNFLDALFRATENPDFTNPSLPKQTAQHIIKQAVQDMKSFWSLIRERKKGRADVAKPHMPSYKKQDRCSFEMTNQDCCLRKGALKTVTENKRKGRISVDGNSKEKSVNYLKLPLTKYRVQLFDHIQGQLKNATVTPVHGILVLNIVFEVKASCAQENKPPQRVCTIDLGIDNIATVTNNLGLPSLLFKGGVVKSVNRLYNKRVAEMMSKQTTGTTEKFKPTPEFDRVTLHRNNVMRDFMSKVAGAIIAWCIENKIDIIVIGENKGWKNEVDMGSQNNQNFVQIPFSRLKHDIAYLGETAGITVEFQEESYTSKASFRKQDPIPVYGDENIPEFSGKRRPTRYRSNYRKKGGFRGLYRDFDGVILNSDINGAANIGRKRYPRLFKDPTCVNFSNVEMIIHPDWSIRKENRSGQLKSRLGISVSKQKRLARKKAKVIPMG